MIEADIFFTNIFAIAIKSSSIAQIIRKESTLFDLLIENKDTNEFLSVDYKTFADVLIQETARNDLNILYPNLGQKLLGEENNDFRNKLNISIKVKVCENVSMTKILIMKIVDNHEDLADQLAKVIHRNVSEYIDPKFTGELSVLSGKHLSISDIEMWIDPIDATKEYISGIGLDDLDNVMHDIDCIKNATVLLGVYNGISGVPIAGVICQPFHHIDSQGLWHHSHFWGICYDSISLYSDNIRKRVFSVPGQIITSYRDVEDLSANLNKPGEPPNWEIIGRSGAGFKLLSLCTSSIDCCIIPQGSTYKWDTCGPHGILLSIGGGLVDYQKIKNLISQQILSNSSSESEITDFIRAQLTNCQVQYVTTGSGTCNSGGLIAYTDPEIVTAVIKSLLRI